MSKLEVGLSLSCIDYRLFEATIELLRQQCEVNTFDHTILAGASLGFNQNEYSCWPITWLEHVELAIKLHDIKTIVVIDHEDCGAYRLFYPESIGHPQCERKLHIKNIKKFIKHVRNIYPNFQYRGYLLALDGSAERIYP